MGYAIKRDRRYAYADYLRWSDGERWEIIDGAAYDMSPAPRIRHQDIVGNFYVRLKTHPENPCYTGISPTDVVFDPHNVVQPDLFLVCDREKVTENNIKGAPDLIIEVVSPGTEIKDRREKRALYERFGVEEYLIVFPEREYVEYYLLVDGRFQGPELFNWDESLRLRGRGIALDLWEIFEKPPPSEGSGVDPDA